MDMNKIKMNQLLKNVHLTNTKILMFILLWRIKIKNVYKNEKIYFGLLKKLDNKVRPLPKFPNIILIVNFLIRYNKNKFLLISNFILIWFYFFLPFKYLDLEINSIPFELKSLPIPFHFSPFKYSPSNFNLPLS